MGRKSNSEKALDQAFKVHFDRVQIPIFDIPRIYSRARMLVGQGLTADQALALISEGYKLPKQESGAV